MSQQQVNLKALSQMLGLSQTTVSRALNGFPEVSEKTRLRVVETANRVNYQPSSTASKLATGKSRTIGHVIPLADHMMINPHFSDFISGASEEYAGYDYDLLLRVAPIEEEEKIYRALAQQKRVDGVVIHGPLTDDPRIALLKDIGLPFVVHGRSDDVTVNYSWLDVNNCNGFYRATEFLINLRHKEIGLINGLESMNFAEKRRMGFENAMTDNGLIARKELMFAEDMLEPYGYKAMQQMLSESNPPSAVLTSSILPALGVQRAISDRGKKMGKDISLIAYDDCLSFLNTYSANGAPPFTCLRSSMRDAGKRVAAMLIAKIEGLDNGHVQELWEADLVVGQSTGRFHG